jgi:hypothetical protein
MKNFFALLFAVALFAVGCEGGFDISDLFRGNIPDPVYSEAVLDIDQDGNYILSSEGGELSIKLSVVKECLDIDLVSQFIIAISDEAKEWIHISRLDDVSDGTLVVVIDENYTDAQRFADIVMRPDDNTYLNYTVNLVQMSATYTPENIINPDVEE